MCSAGIEQSEDMKRLLWYVSNLSVEFAALLSPPMFSGTTTLLPLPPTNQHLRSVLKLITAFHVHVRLTTLLP